MLEIAEKENYFLFIMSEEAGKTIYTCEAFRNSSYIIGIVQMIMLPIYSKTFF